MSLRDIFHKNKRLTKARLLRRVFVAAFLFTPMIAPAISNLVKAELVPTETIVLSSEHAIFDNSDPGAWKLTKSARWTSKTTAELKLSIDSIAKPSGNDKDLILVIDNSSSMGESKASSPSRKILGIQSNAAELIRNTLDNQDSQIAIISFATDAEIVSPFTNDADTLITALNSIEAYGSTNYYKALLKVEEVLASYTVQDGRDIVVLFITDGYPVKDTPKEILEYIKLKNDYPSLIINSVQYDVGENIIPQLEMISDDQYVVTDPDSLDKILFDAASVPYYYSSFNVEDYVDTDYWTITNTSTNIGEIVMDNNEAVLWNLGRYFHPGQETKPELTIKLDLKEQFHEADDKWRTDTRIAISSTIQDNDDEDIDTTASTVLQHKYDVSYSVSLPEECGVDVAPPETTRYFVWDNVEIDNISVYCGDYELKEWQVAIAGVERINTDYLRMPSNDVILRAIWSKLSIGKSMRGTVHEKVTATFDKGSVVNIKMKKLAGNTDDVSVMTADTHIISIKKAFQLDPNIDINDESFVLSSEDSEIPIYGWYDDGAFYYYTEADNVFMNEVASYMFRDLHSLNDIDVIGEWNTSNTRNMGGMFYGSSISNIDALIGWDTSNVTDMNNMLAISSVINIDGAINWDTSKVTNMAAMFYGADLLSNIDGAINWDTSNVTSMSQMFNYADAFSDISGAANWNTSKVTNMNQMFNSTIISDLDPLSNWDVSNVTDMFAMFRGTDIQNLNGLSGWDISGLSSLDELFNGATQLSDISGVANWNTSNITSMRSTFSGSITTNIDALSDWQVGNVTNMTNMFSNNKKLANIDGAANWDTSKVTRMDSMFYGANSLDNIDGAINWDISNVTSVNNMFCYATSLVNIDGAVNWNTSKITDMSKMFCYATSLANINGARNWDTSKVTNMSEMFFSAHRAMTLSDISGARNWDTSKVTNMRRMFKTVANITNLDDLSNWDVSSVTTMAGMFDGYEGGSSLADISGISGWDVSNVVDMSVMFRNAKISTLDDLSNWDTSSLTSIDEMFVAVNNITNINGLRNWDMSNVTNMYMAFSSATSLNDLSGASGWNTSKVINMANTFSGTAVQNLNGLENWDTSKVTNMMGLFHGDKSLTDLSSIANWDVSSVTNMSRMFGNNTLLSDISDLSEWNVSRVTNMNQMFYYDTNITDLSPLENWQTINLETSAEMFYRIPDTVTRPSWYQ